MMKFGAPTVGGVVEESFGSPKIVSLQLMILKLN
jgi:hypothetical protein